MEYKSSVTAGTHVSAFLLLAVVVLVLPTSHELLHPHGHHYGAAEATITEKSVMRDDGERQPKVDMHMRTRTRTRNVRRHRRQEDVPLAGGYYLVPEFKDDAVILEAAVFAFQELRSPSEPYSISKAVDAADFEIIRVSQQVVAGLNIRLDLVFRDRLGDCAGGGTVVVYNHFGDLSVQSWKAKESACGDLGTTAYSNDEKGVVVLEDFSNPMHAWGEMNDPVMGGKSIGTFHIENGLGRFIGEVVDVPFLHAPGFIKGHTTDHNVFPDVTSCQALQLIVKSNEDYGGYRISFGRAHAPGGKFFAFGYKANLVGVPTSAFGKVTIFFSQFTDFWDDATGDPIHTCQEDSRFCPDELTLKNFGLLELWGEGVGGRVDLEVQRIQAVGCHSDSS